MNDNQCAYIKGFPIKTKEQMVKTIPVKLIDEEWDKNIQNMFWYHTSMLEAFKQKNLYNLRKILLSFGGSEVCLPLYDEDAQKIIERGQLWYGDRVLLKRGYPNQCHANSAEIWNYNPKTYCICTGYALSEDGMWRQHSWCVEPRTRKSRIIETTTTRVYYFGYVLDEEESKEFYDRQL